MMHRWRLPEWGLRRTVLLLLALAPLLSPLVKPYPDYYFMYPCQLVIGLLAGVCCLVAARRNPGAERQWRLLSAVVFLASFFYGYLTLGHFHSVYPKTGLFSQQIHEGIRSANFSLRLGLILLAVSFFRWEEDWRVRALDATLLVLCVATLFPAEQSGQSFGHGELRQALNFLLFFLFACIAQAAAVSNTSEALRGFFRAVTIYLWAGVVIRFLIDIVDYTLLPKPYLLPTDLLGPLPEILLCEFALRKPPRPQTGPQTGASPLEWAFIGNMQASILAIGTAAVALFVLQRHLVWYVFFLVLIVTCYAVRTHVFYSLLLREQQRLQVQARQMETLAITDPLTGIGNRRWFERQVLSCLAAPEPPAVVVMLIDTDSFKGINDRFGHHSGDAVLCRVAEVLQDVIGRIEGACCSRLGGDEFAAMLPGVTAAQAQDAAESFRKKIADLDFEASLFRDAKHDGALEKATVSVGVAAVQGHRIEFGTLLRWADAALYRAKADGRNCVRLIDLSSMDAMDVLSAVESFPRIGRDPNLFADIP
ncbi:GGDEF domain-containing protein [Silvibacterium dinghuense]|uniref:diguanylate cyclase n=1 Tax=Silvibacterium dinghuense TaxID=1560006 RepID=A0A4Q1S9T7_9BACT|nr:GGDEF domain-containing protein [Silvibacterium dinghuense]RXS93798.1 GGDEF domain-containing protein [Silvibacterium dinghuense]